MSGLKTDYWISYCASNTYFISKMTSELVHKNDSHCEMKAILSSLLLWWSDSWDVVVWMAISGARPAGGRRGAPGRGPISLSA